MSFWNQYPYTDFHDINLDWIIKKIKEVTKEMNDFKVVNQIVWGGLHDPGKEYPRWCIVDTPTHEGYISIQPVPAGVTIDNEDYWRQVANYSALYADFQNRIVALEADVDALEYAAQKKYILIADSYGGLGWTNDVSTRLDLNADILNVGGAGFAAAGGGSTWLDALTAHAATMTDDEKNAVTDIIIGGGVNDYSFSKSQIRSAIRGFVAYASATFPRAKIGVACISWMNRDNDVSLYINRVIPTYQEEFQSYGNTYYIKNAYLPMHNYSNIQADGIHPNADGTKAITDFMCNYIQKGSADYIVCSSPTITPINYSGTLLMNTKMSAEGVDITFSGGTITLSSPHTFNSLSAIMNIASIEGGCALGLVDNGMDVNGIPSIIIPVEVTLVTSDSKQYTETVLLSMYNGYLGLTGYIQDTAGATPIAPATGSVLVFAPATYHASLLSS